MPMHRWMQSAAGGTSQRLKPAVAIVRSLSRNPAPAPDTVPALLIVVIVVSPCRPPLMGAPAIHNPVVLGATAEQFPHCCSAQFQDAPGSISAFENHKPQTPSTMPIAVPTSAKFGLPGNGFVSCTKHDSTSAAPRRNAIGTEAGTGVDRQKVDITQPRRLPDDRRRIIGFPYRAIRLLDQENDTGFAA